jgi:hypothetical protein
MMSLSKSSRTTFVIHPESRPLPAWWWGLAAILLLAAAPLRAVFESRMPGHMLLQLPLLIVAGMPLGVSLREAFMPLLERFDRHGIATILAALFTLAFWMLPRSLDAALADPFVDALKFLSVPALIGLPVALAWPRLPGVARGFVFGNLLSMLAVLGWLYLAAPVRVCNFYLTGDQSLTGKGLLLLAAAGGLYWLVSAFSGGLRQEAG